MTYLCEACGASFEEPSCYREYQGEHFGYPAYEELAGCPACGGEDYEEAEACALCGEETPLSQLENGACPACRGEVLRSLQELLAQSFTPRELALLRELDWAGGLL